MRTHRRPDFQHVKHSLTYGIDLDPTMNSGQQILSINTGSSSLKVTVSEVVVRQPGTTGMSPFESPEETAIFTGVVERIGGAGCRLRLKDAGG